MIIILNDVLETTIGLATSRKVSLGGLSMYRLSLMRMAFADILGEGECEITSELV
jgi:hypothetical protein